MYCGECELAIRGGERILVYFALLLGILCACGSLVYADYGV
jgi:hypothetical protein